MDNEQLQRFESEVRRIRGYSPHTAVLGLVFLFIVEVAPIVGTAQPVWFNLMVFGVIKREQHER